MPFTSLGLGPKITKAVREAGYTEPTPIQTKAIPVVLAGKDMIGIAQTGTGKTAAFVLPILERLSGHGSASGRKGIRCLIVAPTRELVVQIEENARAYAKHLHISVATVYGGVGEQPQISALRRGTEIVIATPGRLIDLMQQGHVKYDDLEGMDLRGKIVFDHVPPEIKSSEDELCGRLPQLRPRLGRFQRFDVQLSRERVVFGNDRTFLVNSAQMVLGFQTSRLGGSHHEV